MDDSPPPPHTHNSWLVTKSSTFSFFFLSFLPSVSRSFPASLFPSASSPDPLLLSPSGFSSGNRRLNGSFQDTDILSCLFSSLQSCFPIQVMFPAGKLGPHKSCWQPQTDPVENHPILGRRLKRTILVCVCRRQFTPLWAWTDRQSHYPHSSVSPEMERPFSNLIVTCFLGCGMWTLLFQDTPLSGVQCEFPQLVGPCQ